MIIFLRLMDAVYFSYIVLPLLIFLSKVADVSIGTIRIIFVNKGHRFFAPIFGFFEVLIWIIAISNLMQNLNSFWLYIVYAIGFSVGTYVGIRIEEKISFGKVLVRVIVRKSDTEILENLRNSKFRFTVFNASSGRDEKKVLMIFSAMNRKDVSKFLDTVRATNPKAFFSIEDIRRVREVERVSDFNKIDLFRFFKKK